MKAIRERNAADKAARGSLAAAGPKNSLAVGRGSAAPSKAAAGRGGKSAEDIAALDAKMKAIRERNAADKAAGTVATAGPKVKLSASRGALEKVNSSGRSAAEEAALDEKIKQMRLRASSGKTGGEFSCFIPLHFTRIMLTI
jgi:hypothetical protein